MEYCEATEQHYIPRYGELCLAIYLDQWYRGVCLNRSETPDTALIQFIDYGNVEVVDHKNIRRITKEFNDVVGLGCTCTVKSTLSHEAAPFYFVIREHKLTIENKFQISESNW